MHAAHLHASGCCPRLPEQGNGVHTRTLSTAAVCCSVAAQMPSTRGALSARCQVAVMVGLAVTYTVTAGDALLALAMRGGLRGVTRGGCIVAFSVLEAGLAQVNNDSCRPAVCAAAAVL